MGTELSIDDSLLPLLTVYPNVKGYKSKEVDTLVDSGSQQAFIASDLADELNLKVVNLNVPLIIKGFNGNNKVITKTFEFPVTIGKYRYTILCICVPQICIRVKTPKLNKLIKLLKDEGHTLAYKQFERMITSEVRQSFCWVLEIGVLLQDLNLNLLDTLTLVVVIMRLLKD